MVFTGVYTSSPFSIKIIQDSFNVLPRLLDSLIGLETLYGLPELWFQEKSLRDFLQMNIHEGISWFNQEAIETLLDLSLGLLAVFPELMSIESSFSHEELKKLQRSVLSAIEASNYQEEAFIEAYNTLSNGTIRRSEQNR